MQRLRPLTEEECYLRCYGWATDEVRVLTADDADEAEDAAAVTERIRLAFEAGLEAHEAEAA
jgi:hypothetical protein